VAHWNNKPPVGTHKEADRSLARPSKSRRESDTDGAHPRANGAIFGPAEARLTHDQAGGGYVSLAHRIF
jgi:hypothetical protein